jgi:cyclic beta-1,2-glucan synthetase
VHKSPNGTLHRSNPLLWQRIFLLPLYALICATVVALSALLLHLPGRFSLFAVGVPLSYLLATFCVTLPGLLIWRYCSTRLMIGSVVRTHAKWLIPGETVLIIQAPVEALQRPMELLRESCDPPPALFILHPQRERRTEVRSQASTCVPTQMVEHAVRHAMEQRLEPQSRHSTELLSRLKKSRQWVRQVYADLAAASRMEQKATPVADWILDNEYILEWNARDILLNLPGKFYRQLPTISSAPYQGLPSIYGLAKDLVAHTELHLDQENILKYIEAFQTVRILTVGELWAIPQMLRIALIESIQSLAVTALADLRERQLAEFWANRLIAANRRAANQLFALLARLEATEPHPSAYFAAQLVGLLYDEEGALAPVQSWLERTLKTPFHELNMREQNRQTADQMACGNAFTSLRQLALLDWRKVFEQLCRVELLLRRDPAGIYAQMDFATRDRCRQAVEALALASGLSEPVVVERVLRLATDASRTASVDDRRSHVGSWLSGTGRTELSRLLNCRETMRHRILEGIYRHHAAVYSLAFVGACAACLTLIACFRPVVPSLAIRLCLLLLLIPVSQVALEIVNYLITRLLPPRPLPKMAYEECGIPDEFRTLVVVPMMLVNEATLRSEVEKLEIRYLANKEDNLLFSLFTDYTDSITLSRDDDSRLVQSAVTAVTELNHRYGGERFYLFHRERIWSASEQKYIGWERKRGKLEELNRLIDGTRPENAEQLVYVGEPQALADVRFVITLDSDTQLPHGTARRLVETLAHPLNQPRFTADGAVMAGTYTIIQPRVSPTLPSTSASIFSRLFADAVGVDPYNQAVSDVYQDLSGEGSYHGKGIYDVRAFSRVLTGRFPEEWVLSHDLIEGAHVRVGLASDIELYDEFPQGYQSYSSRSHRWIRGDWQIAGWLFQQVPLASGGRGGNPLSLFNRWKIFDNLRRSLLPATNLGLLTLSWFISPQASVIASLVVTIQLLFHPLAQPFTMATTLKGFKYFSPAKLLHDLLRATADAALLPHQAAVTIDAIVRVWYRRVFSRRDLLEWTAQAQQWSTERRQRLFVASLGLGSLFSVTVAAVLWWLMPGSLPAAAPWLVLWLFSPLLGWLLNLKTVDPLPLEQLPEADRRFLSQIARRTWRYFSTFVTIETNWLPPDNYQVAHQNCLAMRTSPTNIGLWLTTVVAAHDCGYLPVTDVIKKIAHTMNTLHNLEHYEGHLLNWYDIKTLAPLEPRYVSTVDSGNLLGALWVLEQAVEELLHAPLLDAQMYSGLADTGAILKQELTLNAGAAASHATLDRLVAQWLDPPVGGAALLRGIAAMQGDVADLCAATASSPWSVELSAQWGGWIANNDTYLSWLTLLAEPEESCSEMLELPIRHAIADVLLHAPSMTELAHDQVTAIRLLRELRAESPQLPETLLLWLDRILEAYATARWLAGETLADGEQVLEQIRSLSAGMNMRFLYDSKRKLFTIGYNVSLDRCDDSSYDLLASEARLGSFVAIARGDVPLEHWFTLGRPYGAVGRQRMLLSWTGTMFEYLMPLLFQRSYDNSLLDKAAREAVVVQIAYGKKCSVPWGISESAYADLDLNKTYQYKAFGVPNLGLKRGLEEQLVVAPYAALLAVTVAPVATVANLKRLAELGMLAEYGFYEAIDFSRQTRREGARGVKIEAYMAHHQGMAFIAVCNFLHGGAFQRRFHADPRVRAFEALLQERIPTMPPLQLMSTRPGEALPLSRNPVAPAGITFTTPHTARPRSQLLSNGRYGVMITNSGGGYSQWGGSELTRWRSDITGDSYGTYCYIHETDPKQLWSVTYQPVGGTVKKYSADFALDRAVFHRSDKGIHTQTEVVVSPEDDVEVRRITLVNRTSHPRQLAVTSYVELSMAPHNADRQHPAFNKLFIQTEAVPELEALLAYRRPRSASDTPLCVGHCLTRISKREGEADAEPIWQFETDRGRFIGRGHTLANPMGATQEPGNSQGFVLDPILSIRRPITLAPGQRVQFSLVIAAAATRDQMLPLLEKYRDPVAVQRAMDFAWGSAQQQLQLLHIQPDEARRFQQLAGHLLFPNHLLRAPADRLAENHKGQAALWPYAISGDLPIVLITIGEVREVSLVRQVLHAHTYWRMHGLSTDLVILNEEVEGYEKPLQDRLQQLIQAHTVTAATDRPGGIFLKNVAQIGEADLTLLKAAANVVLVAARGTLPQQLSALADVPELPTMLPRRRMPRDASAPLPFMELHYFNSLGGFSQDGHEYAIYLGPGTNTPAPWVNVIANPDFGTMISETGSGFTWFGNSQRNRLSGWSNDPVLDPPSEALYIRDEESGVYWSPTAAPIREESAYRARHGAGYTMFEHNSNGIEQELTVMVPVNSSGGDPIKLQRLRLVNSTSRPRSLSITWYVELALGENRETTQMHVQTGWDDTAKVLLAYNHYHPEYGERVAFAAMTPHATSYSGDRCAFIGRNRTLSSPAALEHVRLSNRTGAGLDPCAALRTLVEIPPGESREVICLLGQGASRGAVDELLQRYRDDQAFERVWGESRVWWDELLGTLHVHTPELGADLLINRWLQYQTLSCRLWGRSGFYQSGGAFGFRDQLQDVLACLYSKPELAREQILLAASRQFKEGDVQHWWHPPTGIGIRTRISDDLLWLPYVVARYVRVTGDSSILHAEVSFLTAPLLTPEQHELLLTPEITFDRASLFEHCRRAVGLGLTEGPHGLPLMGGGDWNDGMNLVGAGGKGESVWLGWFLCDLLQGMAELAELLTEPELAHVYQEQRTTLSQRIEAAGWDGEWYQRGTFDDGSPLGSAQNSEARIDSLPQSWAVLSGAADTERAGQGLEAAWQMLVKPADGLVQLFDPPFNTSEPSPGYIKGYPPGVRENGGQYTHAALWLAMAFARRGDGERTMQLLRMLNPVEHARDAAAVWRYGVEPYVVAADVYRVPGRVGHGGWSWYTGSAAWMYRAWVEEVLGMKLCGNSMRIEPVIPRTWPGFSISYRHGDAWYDIQVTNPQGVEHGVATVELDGQLVADGRIPLERNAVKHQVMVRMGEPQ